MSHLWPVLPALPEWVPRLSPLTVSRWVPLSTWPSIAQAAQSRPSRWGCQARVQHDSSPPCTRVPPEHACTLCTPAHVHTCLHTGPGAARVWGSRTHFPRPLASWLHAAHVLEKSWAHFTLHTQPMFPCPKCARAPTVPTSAVCTGVHVQPCEHSLTCVYLFF